MRKSIKILTVDLVKVKEMLLMYLISISLDFSSLILRFYDRIQVLKSKDSVLLSFILFLRSHEIKSSQNFLNSPFAKFELKNLTKA